LLPLYAVIVNDALLAQPLLRFQLLLTCKHLGNYLFAKPKRWLSRPEWLFHASRSREICLLNGFLVMSS